MDYLGEAIALGIDTLILGVCLKQYWKNRNAVQMIQGAPLLEINDELKDIVQSHPERKLNYVAIRGTVRAIGPPIVSNNNPKIQGVVQLLSIKEHVVQRSTAGFWADQERTIQEVHNVMPFSLEQRHISIEVIDPLAADILDMDVISDQFQPTVPSVMDHVWGFFSGVRQRGVQTTERMLRQGAIITGIGELAASSDGQVRLQPPSNGGAFYLTNMQITSLVRRLEERRRNYRLASALFGAAGLLLVGLLLRRYIKDRNRRRQEKSLHEELEQSRKDRRRRMRDSNEQLTEQQLCVVCRQNPREIILLPCGHVCLCEDCADGIHSCCPVCRCEIERKSAAYIS